ncbi:MAG: hypothetical protein ACRDZ4_14245 [Egibacteraceae bacterium]
MGLLRKSDENPGGGSGLELDLDLRSCPVCRRDLHPWEPTCPDDGAGAVPRNLRTSDIPPPPAHLLGDDEPE